MGLLSHRTSYLPSRRRRRGRHRRLRRRSSLRSPCGRTALCVWLSAARQRHVRRTDRSDRAHAVLRPHRPRAARRGDELSLSATGSTFAEAPDAALLARVEEAGRALADIALHRGATWTTDAPYRETEAAILRARDLGALAVEMEAAALYAFSAATGHPVICFAHVTNAMAQTEGDFEKGEADGAKATLAFVSRHGSRMVGPSGQELKCSRPEVDNPFGVFRILPVRQLTSSNQPRNLPLNQSPKIGCRAGKTK